MPTWVTLMGQIEGLGVSVDDMVIQQGGRKSRDNAQDSGRKAVDRAFGETLNMDQSS